MRVADVLPRKYRPRKDWVGIARQVRQHAGKWVEVDQDAPASLAWRINAQQGPKALRDSDEYTYEASALGVTDNRRCHLWIRATEREEE